MTLLLVRCSAFVECSTSALCSRRVTPTEDQFRGALVGLALGDALGAPHEGGVLERLVWRVMGTARGLRRFTDDTQMSLDLAASLIERGGVDQDDLAMRFASGYQWDRGYGPGAASVLKSIRRGASWREASRSVYPEGSLGNGGAMRAPVVGLFFHDRPERVDDAARLTAEITHAHPLGITGAQLVARATVMALARADGATLRSERAAAVASRCGRRPGSRRTRERRRRAAARSIQTPRALIGGRAETSSFRVGLR